MSAQGRFKNCLYLRLLVAFFAAKSILVLEYLGILLLEKTGKADADVIASVVNGPSSCTVNLKAGQSPALAEHDALYNLVWWNLLYCCTNWDRIECDLLLTFGKVQTFLLP